MGPQLTDQPAAGQLGHERQRRRRQSSVTRRTVSVARGSGPPPAGASRYSRFSSYVAAGTGSGQTARAAACTSPPTRHPASPSARGPPRRRGAPGSAAPPRPASSCGTPAATTAAELRRSGPDRARSPSGSSAVPTQSTHRPPGPAAPPSAIVGRPRAPTRSGPRCSWAPRTARPSSRWLRSACRRRARRAAPTSIGWLSIAVGWLSAAVSWLSGDGTDDSVTHRWSWRRADLQHPAATCGQTCGQHSTAHDGSTFRARSCPGRPRPGQAGRRQPGRGAARAEGEGPRPKGRGRRAEGEGAPGRSRTGRLHDYPAPGSRKLRLPRSCEQLHRRAHPRCHSQAPRATRAAMIRDRASQLEGLTDTQVCRQAAPVLPAPGQRLRGAGRSAGRREGRAGRAAGQGGAQPGKAAGGIGGGAGQVRADPGRGGDEPRRGRGYGEGVALSLAISPCPNDTFVFHALVHGRVPGAPAGRGDVRRRGRHQHRRRAGRVRPGEGELRGAALAAGRLPPAALRRRAGPGLRPAGADPGDDATGAPTWPAPRWRCRATGPPRTCCSGSGRPTSRRRGSRWCRSTRSCRAWRPAGTTPGWSSTRPGSPTRGTA